MCAMFAAEEVARVLKEARHLKEASHLKEARHLKEACHALEAAAAHSEEQLLRKHALRFRDGLVCKPSRLFVSLNSRLESNKEEASEVHARERARARARVCVRERGRERET